MPSLSPLSPPSPFISSESFSVSLEDRGRGPSRESLKVNTSKVCSLHGLEDCQDQQSTPSKGKSAIHAAKARAKHRHCRFLATTELPPHPDRGWSRGVPGGFEGGLNGLSPAWKPQCRFGQALEVNLNFSARRRRPCGHGALMEGGVCLAHHADWTESGAASAHGKPLRHFRGTVPRLGAIGMLPSRPMQTGPS